MTSFETLYAPKLNPTQQLAEAQSLYDNARQQIQNAIQNVGEAARFLLEGENRHPNRHDICAQGTQGAPFGEFLVGKRPKSIYPEGSQQSNNPFSTNSNAVSQQPNPFGGSSAPAATNSLFGPGNNTTNVSPFSSGRAADQGSEFGQPSALGAKPNPFGTPAFGQPAQPAANASTFGQSSETVSPFGQPSQPAAPPFGQPPQPASSAFGQPSALGAKPNPFGAPAFGQAAQAAQPATPANRSAFGQAGQLGAKPNPFGSSNSNSNGTTGASPFGNSAPVASPFGNTANNSLASPFGTSQPSQPATTPFGQASQPAAPNPFSSTNNTNSQPSVNPFASPAPASDNSNPFGSSAPAGQPAANPFSTAPTPAKPAGPPQNPYSPKSGKQHPPLDSYVSKNMDGSLGAFKGKPVTYKDGVPGIRTFDGTWSKIWFPDGPPSYYKDTELRMADYTEHDKNQWMQFASTDSFEGGVMPSAPPPRECTQWNF